MKNRSGEPPNAKELSSLPGWAHSLAAKGPLTEQIIHLYFAQHRDENLFNTADTEALRILGDSVRSDWSDEEAAKIVDACINSFVQGRHIDVSALARWVLLHPSDSAAVLDCLTAEPPEEINIIKVLSRAGSQKLVFLATWRLTQRQVVLRKLTGTPETVSKVVVRELTPHPLSMTHPNIIETHILKNAKGQAFLVEKCLPVVLSDKWLSHGVQEAANLLYNISDAVAFLHDHNLIHGDIKPDNIGKEGDSYILLDFGICRPRNEFTGDTTATGSLRTRAPELLLTNAYEIEPAKVDIWALGATVFNVLVGRFPLCEKDEVIPRASKPSQRGEFEAELARRARDEWDRRVDLSLLPDAAIKILLESALRRDPRQRCSAAELKSRAEKDLSAFLRGRSNIGRFAPLDELRQLKAFFPEPKVLSLMPLAQRQKLRDRLAALKTTDGFDVNQQNEIAKLLQPLVDA